MIKIQNTSLEGLKIVETNHFVDSRGIFHKFFSKSEYEELGLDSGFTEDYYSISKKDVIRGMHFQIPPFDHTKLVYVALGKIIDVCVDLRKDSCTYGNFFTAELSSDEAKALYIPTGFAHGFLSLEDNTVVHYLQTCNYSKECDLGIRYDSFGYDWNVANPIVSQRDLSHVAFKDFDSPFFMAK